MHALLGFINRTCNVAIPILIALLLALILPVAVFAQPDGPPSALDPASPVSTEIANLHNLVLIIAVVIFVLVEGLLLLSALRFRRNPQVTVEPPQVHGNTRLEIAWTVAPALVVVALFVLTVRAQQSIDASAQAVDGSTPITVEVEGHQWWWEFRYPDLGITTANEMVIPVGRTMNLQVSSVDVIHSFWVPELGGKTDAIPTLTNRTWLRADAPGEYYGQCAELCGVSHAYMRLVVRAVPQAEFDAWAQGQAQNAIEPTDPAIQAGRDVFANGPCVGCHVIRGIPQAVGQTGPDLTHFAGRPYIGAGILGHTPYNLARWLADPPGVKPGSLMPNLNLSRQDIDALVAYLESLK
ncbi:MAG TPA: cytochrome c oxidase subunit II [Anaerolineae bacterium]|nr:cytochrome c oxidase subunit II [Anaerolineae bacterium]